MGMFITMTYIRHNTSAQISDTPGCHGPDLCLEDIFLKWQVLTVGLMFDGKSVILHGGILAFGF